MRGKFLLRPASRQGLWGLAPLLALAALSASLLFGGMGAAAARQHFQSPISPLPTPPFTPTPSTSPTNIPWLWIIVGVVVIGGLLALGLILSRRR